ncbi:hypothetical protein [Singulisphaera sp. GP187]|uniref:hypothetical protein n=1 Tax=Singulisphaera sp. GP187 TaxID=1882752 RepID=UPI0013563CD9|nr:hypothetical protein [Singulisphaera sp. GP187]
MPRAADPVVMLSLAVPTSGSLSAPLERRRGRVPVPGYGLEPGVDLADIHWVLTRQGPPLQDPLHTLGHVRPRPTHVPVRLPHRLTLGIPGLPGIGDRLERTGLVGAPDRQTIASPSR